MSGISAILARRKRRWNRGSILRDGAARVAGLRWQRQDVPPRTARRADTETSEDVVFPSGALELAGTLTLPKNEFARTGQGWGPPRHLSRHAERPRMAPDPAAVLLRSCAGTGT